MEPAASQIVAQCLNQLCQGVTVVKPALGYSGNMGKYLRL
jgi:hypothetical protein